MSFLAGRAAGKEGAYFFQESKQAVNRLLQNSTSASTSTPTSTSSPPPTAQADVLPEVLRHSLCFKPSSDASSLPSSLPVYSASKWAVRHHPTYRSSVSPDTLNPLRAQLALPSVSLGPKRWEVRPDVPSVLASTANELRKDRYDAYSSPEKLKAVAKGLAQVGKAFAIATVIVFGGATVGIGLVASKLEIGNSDDIRTRGKDLAQPRLESIKEKFIPIKAWAESTSKKWHFDRKVTKEKSISKELSKMFGPKTSQ